MPTNMNTGGGFLSPTKGAIINPGLQMYQERPNIAKKLLSDSDSSSSSSSDEEDLKKSITQVKGGIDLNQLWKKKPIVSP
jgi:hypothetical protein